MYYTPINAISYSFLSNSVNLENVRNFKSGLTFKVGFKEFRKKVEAPFDIEIEVKFVFEEYKYFVTLNNKEIFFNLYHQEISERQQSELISILAGNILEGIESKI